MSGIPFEWKDIIWTLEVHDYSLFRFRFIPKASKWERILFNYTRYGFQLRWGYWWILLLGEYHDPKDKREPWWY